MNRAFIINAHQPYPFSQGNLNAALTSKINQYLVNRGFETRLTSMTDHYNVDEEIENHRWAELLILQSPVNWMGVPWSFKKYMDEVYSAGMDGRLCVGDGRTSTAPRANYGGGGALKGKHYMMSLTFNAPEESFSDKNEYLFRGRSVDDLFFPMHMNFRFFGMSPLDTFACFDVMKNPQIETDFKRLESHLEQNIPNVAQAR